jgi:hypothetical protein
MDVLINERPHKLCVIVEHDSNKRRQICNYIQNCVSEIFATSLFCNAFGPENQVVDTFFKCDCDCDSLIPLKYNLGCMSNNYEYYSGHCSECNCFPTYEPNYNDGPNDHIIRLPRNNVIILGSKNAGRFSGNIYLNSNKTYLIGLITIKVYIFKKIFFCLSISIHYY